MLLTYHKTNSIVNVRFRNIGDQGLLIKNNIGFEVSNGNEWFNAFDGISINDAYSINIKINSSIFTGNMTQIRYNWYTSPCLPREGIYNCAIYDKEFELPAIPFIYDIQ